MRDIYELLREKQNAIGRLNREIAALRVAASLLQDDDDIESLYANPSVGTVAHGDSSKDLYPAKENRVQHERAHPDEDMVETGDIDSGMARRIALRIRELAGPFWSVKRSLVDSA